ncbi:MAG: tetratricopeptide repeat protein [Candidatus Obscuribacterales bacterium]|nr:tetratricopeptide repeat protein [Candidatus Obscuribacterales bacterium]
MLKSPSLSLNKAVKRSQYASLNLLILIFVQNFEGVFAAPSEPAQTNAAVAELVMQIDPLMQQKRYSEAEILLKKALIISPDNPSIHASYGYAIQKQGRFEESVEHYEAALKGLPDATLVRMSFGHVLKNLGRYEEALTQYKQVLAQDPSYPMALRMTAAVLILMQRSQDSVQYANKLLEVEPTLADKLFLADILEQSRNYDAALSKYKEILVSDPKFLDAVNGCAACLWSMGQQSEAVSYYERATEIDPARQRSWLKLLHYYLRTGRLKDWITCEEKVAERFPDSPELKRLTNYKKEVAADVELNTLCQHNSVDYLNRASHRSGKKTWNERIIPVYIEPTQSSTVGGNPKFNEILREAFKDWAEASAGRVSFKFVEMPTQSLITCRWISNPDQLPITGTNACCTAKSDGARITKADIVLLTTNSTFPDTALPLDYVKAITRHEVGHALGLEGHSDDVKDVMFTYPGSSKLTQRDVNTIRRLYAKKS